MAELVAAWPAAVGEAIAANAWPARLSRDGTLHVATSSSAWAFELAQFESELLANLRGAVEEAAPARLRFAPGRLPEHASVASERRAFERPQPTVAEREEAEQLVAAISDQKLRKIVARAAAASLSRAAAGRGV